MEDLINWLIGAFIFCIDFIVIGIVALFAKFRKKSKASQNK